MIYDHERDAESRRGRPVADWGGDDLFTSAPRRRLKSTTPRARRVSGPATGAQAARRGEAPVPRPSLAVADHHEERVHAPQAVQPAALPAPVELPAPLPLPESAVPAPAPLPERRTVAISGHPDRFPPSRRRPSPTLEDRITGRPDRIAGWAFGLGITLILIAVGTADGGAF